MDKSTIEALRHEVPVSPLGSVATDTEIWEQNDGGAHLKITRHELGIDNFEILALSVSGLKSERDRVRSEFSDVYGVPSETDEATECDTTAWLVSGNKPTGT